MLVYYCLEECVSPTHSFPAGVPPGREVRLAESSKGMWGKHENQSMVESRGIRAMPYYYLVRWRCDDGVQHRVGAIEWYSHAGVMAATGVPPSPDEFSFMRILTFSEVKCTKLICCAETITSGDRGGSPEAHGSSS